MEYSSIMVELPSGKRLQNTDGKKISIFNGKTHYFYGHFQ